MTIEITLWWFLAGLIADAFLNLVVTARSRSSIKALYLESGQQQPPFLHDYLEILIEVPWWGRVMIYALPISIFLHPALSDENY